jgi:subtilisin family serine protease
MRAKIFCFILLAATRLAPGAPRPLDSNETSVVVHLNGQLDLAKFYQNSSPQTERVKELVSALKAFNQKSLKPIVRHLSATKVTPLWITNSVRIRGPARVVDELLAMNGIEALERDLPKEIFALETGNASVAPRTHQATGWGVEKIGAPELWTRGITGRGVVVAMIDSGQNISHPDLKNNLWENSGETGTDAQGRDKTSNEIDDDKNGFIDDLHGWNFEENNANLADTFGHGSETAGIVAGDGTGGKQTGVAPRASLMVVRTCCSAPDSLFEANTWEGLQYAIENGARVLSMSLTIKPFSHPNYAKWRRIGEVLLAADIVHINSAGNLGAGNEPYDIGAPASNPPAWQHPRQTPGRSSSMITVGATDRNDRRQDYSATGPVTWEEIPEYADYPYASHQKPGLIKPDLCAPSEVVSTSESGEGYVQNFGGTSSATPHLAGVIALMLSAKPLLTVAQITEALQMTAFRVDSEFGNGCGAGRVDAGGAVAYAEANF